jgi:arylsulfatase A-like enzyme
MSRRPNIIIFNPDEMRVDTMGHMGNPAAITPALDDFAQHDAVSFRNAYCQNPVCVPSRCSFMTGWYPHVHGHRTMAYLLHPDENSLLRELKQAGYYVWMNARNDLDAGEYPNWVESAADKIFYAGDVKAAPGPVNSNVRGKPGDKSFYSFYRGKLGLDENGKNYTRDDEAVDAAIRDLKGMPEDKPFCMFLGLMFPHPEYGVEEPYYSAIDRSKIPPRIKAEECTGKPKMEASLRKYMNMAGYTDEEWTELRAVYLGMVMKVDAQFKKLCDALKENHMWDNTVVIFMSDHGDFAGDYDLPEKTQNCFEDCLEKVPFLIKPPKTDAVDPGVSEALVELTDFYATVMAYAHAETDHTQFGKDLRPLVADRCAKQLRDAVYSEGGRMPGEFQCDEYHSMGEAGRSKMTQYWPRKSAMCEDDSHIKGTMIFDGRFKYILRADHTDEFYDLKNDPKEMHNQIHAKRYEQKKEELASKMLHWYQDTCDVVPPTYDKRFTPEMLWAQVRQMVPPEKQEKLHAKILTGKYEMLDVIALAKESQKKEG